MNVYVALFNSMLECCDRMGARLGILYTTTMAALGLCLCLNVLSVIDLLWSARVVANPYAGTHGLHPQHYVYGVLYGCLALNTVLARLLFRADPASSPPAGDEPDVDRSHQAIPWLRLPGTAYLLGSVVLFMATLAAGLLR
ncbi:MAG TPA: hypothetical protein VMF03_22140 [Steroidobacteraceae bacterium]|nr:hypothetical protein [Steroidobacteraceae bacterium]